MLNISQMTKRGTGEEERVRKGEVKNRPPITTCLAKEFSFFTRLPKVPAPDAFRLLKKKGLTQPQTEYLYDRVIVSPSTEELFLFKRNDTPRSSSHRPRFTFFVDNECAL